MTSQTSSSLVRRYLIVCLAVLSLLSIPEMTSSDPATQFEPLEVFQDCDVCPEMIVLPMGSFIMGAPLEESALLESLYRKPRLDVLFGLPHEGPQHTVVIDIPIAMSRNEVTREDWQSCVADGACDHTPDTTVLGRYEKRQVNNKRHPVIRVTLHDALDYVAWLNSKVGSNVYRLPTEAEWEYAARAGTQTKFAQGDTLTKFEANFTSFFLVGDRWTTDRRIFTIPLLVNQLDAANGWGLRHMSGNVSEMTLTCFSKRHLALTTTSAYLQIAEKTKSCRRVYKGGDYSSSREHASVAGRRGIGEMIRSSTVGIRVLRELELAPYPNTR